jgi:hypothetical protein
VWQLLGESDDALVAQLRMVDATYAHLAHLQNTALSNQDQRIQHLQTATGPQGPSESPPIVRCPTNPCDANESRWCRPGSGPTPIRRGAWGGASGERFAELLGKNGFERGSKHLVRLVRERDEAIGGQVARMLRCRLGDLRGVRLYAAQIILEGGEAEMEESAGRGRARC